MSGNTMACTESETFFWSAVFSKISTLVPKYAPNSLKFESSSWAEVAIAVNKNGTINMWSFFIKISLDLNWWGLRTSVPPTATILMISRSSWLCLMLNSPRLSFGSLVAFEQVHSAVKETPWWSIDRRNWIYQSINMYTWNVSAISIHSLLQLFTQPQSSVTYHYRPVTRLCRVFFYERKSADQSIWRNRIVQSHRWRRNLVLPTKPFGIEFRACELGPKKRGRFASAWVRCRTCARFCKHGQVLINQLRI